MRADLLVRLAKPIAVLAASFFIFEILMGPEARGVADYAREYSEAAARIDELARAEAEAGRSSALPQNIQCANISKQYRNAESKEASCEKRGGMAAGAH